MAYSCSKRGLGRVLVAVMRKTFFVVSGVLLDVVSPAADRTEVTKERPITEQIEASTKEEADAKFKEKHGVTPKFTEGPFFEVEQKLEIQYDDEMMDVMDRINVLLKSHGLQFNDDGLEHDGFVIYKLEKK